MRLSSRLSDKDKNHGEVESFIDPDKYISLEEEATDEIVYVSSGDFIEIQIGTINLPFYSTICQDSNSFISPKKLHCLIINEKMISIDCQLKCTDFDTENPKCRQCNPYIQAWFLIEADDIFANTPNVNLVKQNFKLPENIKLSIEIEDKYSEWLAKAEIAHKERLGAGAIIYLRSVFEKITHEVGLNAGVKIRDKNGKILNFREVLQRVDSECSIIPPIYAENGYDLFIKLSEIAHGNSDEMTALKEYEPLRRLVIGIIENVRRKNEEIKNNAEIQKALLDAGLADGGEENE
ncbi:hypothetical protein ACWJXL_08615 [Clostridioides difficile]|uniref:hypothetical protein n=2 Tax=Bacteria TaxID=2 RepID=UPI0005DDB9CD|nr:hypothetical protein [Clostridioides difficile]KJF63061.1 hypothetical protein TZ54_11265 [Clostridioides difficile]MCJ0405864.1 hypothetical protein [Clostridioides difficile]MDB2779827.1 hypothetical protein [Clostridioides difficile]MDV9234543.1 hypothetical protein [Clostridioides difficile]OYO87564.1 hypothetical protein B7359_15775 [Clostridioides difficile]